MKPITFVVQGTGQFPIDMLRYDSCIPATEADSQAIESAHRPQRTPRRVTLALRGHATAPTRGRWESFGWSIV